MMGDILKKDGASKSDSKETDEVSMMGGEEKQQEKPNSLKSKPNKTVSLA